MDWVTAAIAAVAAAATVGSWIVAVGASRRSRRALDLQSTIDRRQQEFRDYKWRAGSEKSSSGALDIFTLTNDGTSDASDVVLVVEFPDRPRERYDIGAVPAGEMQSVHSQGLSGWFQSAETSMPVHPTVTVHWVSPRGYADEVTIWEKSLFPGPGTSTGPG